MPCPRSRPTFRSRPGGPARAAATALVCLGLAACTSIREVDTGPGTVVVTTHAVGDVATAYATGDTARRAAQATIDRGYAYYRLTDITFDHARKGELGISAVVQMSTTRDGAGWISARETLSR